MRGVSSSPSVTVGKTLNRCQGLPMSGHGRRATKQRLGAMTVPPRNAGFFRRRTRPIERLRPAGCEQFRTDLLVCADIRHGHAHVRRFTEFSPRKKDFIIEASHARKAT